MDMTLVICTDKLPDDYKEDLKDEGISLVVGRPKRFHDEKVVEPGATNALLEMEICV